MFGIRFRLFFFLDFLFFVASIFAYAFFREAEAAGGVDFSRSRSFEGHGFMGKNTWYIVSDGDTELLRLEIRPIVNQAFMLLAGIVFIQLFILLISSFADYRKIRKTLRPLNEIALQADHLSRLNYADEERIAMIEDAIEHINPGDEAPLSIPDNDLAGIEAAMNNLILRMKDTYRQQTRFVNDASHELRTPIAVIQGYANMLERWGRDDPEVLDESIQAITHEAEHMNRLVEQLLFLARGDSGRTVIKPVAISLPDMMEEIYEESLMIDEAHIYRYKKPAEDILLEADETLLKQAVRILIDNAAKYTQEGSEILLSTGKDTEGQPYLQVQDTGIGMAEADVKHMFERFYRSDETREIRGTGLGLSIAKWIIDKHGGHFEILSRQELGTRIRILLPATLLTTQPPASHAASLPTDRPEEAPETHTTEPSPTQKESSHESTMGM